MNKGIAKFRWEDPHIFGGLAFLSDSSLSILRQYLEFGGVMVKFYNTSLIIGPLVMADAL